jgi:hypothetical protein
MKSVKRKVKSRCMICIGAHAHQKETHRSMDYDYDNGNKDPSRYAYDASQQGPLIGLNIHW